MWTTNPPLYPLTDDNRAGVVVTTAIVTTIFTLIVLAIKFFVRPGFSKRNPSDIAIVISTILYLVETVLVIVACNHGLGQPQSVLLADELKEVKIIILVSQLLGLFSFACSKVSAYLLIDLLIERLCEFGKLRLANRIVAALVFLWVIAGPTLLITGCAGEKSWNSEQCPVSRPAHFLNSLVNILTDSALCTLGFVLSLSKMKSGKGQVLLLFGCRILTVVPTIIGLSTFGPLPDVTWALATTVICFQTSLCLSIITACISSLRSMRDFFFTKRDGVGSREFHELTMFEDPTPSHPIESHQGRDDRLKGIFRTSLIRVKNTAMSMNGPGGESVEILNHGS